MGNYARGRFIQFVFVLRKIFPSPPPRRIVLHYIEFMDGNPLLSEINKVILVELPKKAEVIVDGCKQTVYYPALLGSVVPPDPETLAASVSSESGEFGIIHIQCKKYFYFCSCMYVCSMHAYYVCICGRVCMCVCAGVCLYVCASLEI